MDNNPYQGDPRYQDPPQNPYAGTQPPYQQPPPQPGVPGIPGVPGVPRVPGVPGGAGFQPTAPFPNAPYAQPIHDPRGGVALAGFIIGCIAVFAWCIAICGIIVSIPGLVLSLMGLRSTRRRGLAIAGVIMNGIALFLAFANMILGIIMALSGNQPLWGP